MTQRMFVTIDTRKTNYKNVGKINHGDDLILELTVLSDGYMISFNDPMVDLLVKKSDGKMIRQNYGIEYIGPNKFIIEVSKDCLTSPGLVTNQLIINDNGRISTCMFYYTILKSLEEDIIESISNVEVLEQLDEFTIQIKDKMENFDEELRNRMSELEDDIINNLEELFENTSAELIEAEQSRAQAESVRIQNESKRAKDESLRQQNENSRQSNEAERQKTMVEMRSLIGNVNDFDERVCVIDDKIEEINSSLDNKTTELYNKINEVTIEPKKTTFFNEHKGRNLLNPNNIDFGTWLGNNVGGTTATKEPSANGGWNSFKAVEIEPNKDYVFLVNGMMFTGSNANYSYWYDADGNAISMFSFARVVTSPSNAKYVRASFKGESTSNYGLYQASGIVEHEDYYEPYYTFDTSYLPKEESNKKKTKNLFDEGAITLDSYLPGGNLSGNSNGWKVSDFIEVNQDTDYVLSQQYSTYKFNSNYCWFYDENKSVISNITNNPFTTPSNCKYIRFSIQNEVTYMQLEEGTEIGYYIPYGYEEDYRDLLKSPLLGKKYCPIGDSITASGWGYELARQTGMVINNYNAIGGTTVSGAYDGTTNMCGTTRIQATPADTEIITLMGGSNDWSQQSQGNGIPLGTMSDIKIGEDRVLDKITFTGCYKLMLNRLYRQCPNAQIFILEQTYRYLEDTDRTIPLDAFRKRTLEIAYEYGYPVIHMKQKCGFNEMNYQDYYIDVIHPNGTTGRKRIIEVVKSGILSTIQ